MSQPLVERYDHEEDDRDEPGIDAPPDPVPPLIQELRELVFTDPDALDARAKELEKSLKDDPRLKARVHAYRAIAEFDKTGEIAPRPFGSAGRAKIEIEEVQEAVRYDVARALCGLHLKAFPDSDAVQRCEVLLRGPGSGHGRWHDDFALDVQVIRKEGAKKTLIVFCGFRHRFNISMNTFYHGWLAAYPVNVIVLRDWEKLLYLLGVGSLGTQSESVTKLQEILDGLGSTETITAGNSGGGFGALLYGLLMGAKHSFVFAPPVDLHFVVTYASQKRISNRLIEYRDNGRIVWPDFPKLFTENPEMKAEVFYAQESLIDRRHAETLAGFPNVTLSVIKGEKVHSLLPTLAAQGKLKLALDTALGEPG